MTHEEFKTKAKEVIDTCKKYGFMSRTVHPYSFDMTVEELVKNWADYDRYTYSSKQIMRQELKRFLPILEHWIEVENEPKVMIMSLHNGNVREYPKSTAEELIAIGFGKEVDKCTN